MRGAISSCLFLVFLWWSGAAQAQLKFSAGLIGGLTATQYDGDSYAGYDKLGFILGGFSRTKLNDRWDFQFEIVYFQKGARRNPIPSKGDYRQYALSLDYAEVPVMFRANVKDFVFEGGLGLGVLVRKKEVVDQIDVTNFPSNDNFRRIELDWNLGVGYVFGQNFEVLSRYSYSILPVRPHASGSIYWFNRGEYNNCLTFTLRYHFGAKEEEN